MGHRGSAGPRWLPSPVNVENGGISARGPKAVSWKLLFGLGKMSSKFWKIFGVNKIDSRFHILWCMLNCRSAGISFAGEWDFFGDETFFGLVVFAVRLSSQI